MRNVFRATLLLSAALLAGCSTTSMTGVGGTSDYGCKAPPGVTCKSVSGVYANAIQRNLPSQHVDGEAAMGTPQVEKDTSKVAGMAPTSGMPIRTQSRVLRVWIAPWEDSEGDFNDQSLTYVVVDTGQWVLDHNRRNIANEFAPVRPPAGINATNSTGSTGAAAAAADNVKGFTQAITGNKNQ